MRYPVFLLSVLFIAFFCITPVIASDDLTHPGFLDFGSVSPANPYSFTSDVIEIKGTHGSYDAGEYGYAILYINIYDVGPDELLNFTLSRGYGSPVTGYIVDESGGILGTSRNITLSLTEPYGGDDTGSFTIINTLMGRRYILWYAQNITEGHKGIGLFDTNINSHRYVYAPLDAVGDWPITYVEFECTGEVTFQVFTNPIEEVQDSINENWPESNNAQDIWSQFWSFWGDAVTILILFISWFYFIFILHGPLIIAYVELAIVAISLFNANKRGTIPDRMITFFRNLVNYNQRLIEIVIGAIKVVIEILTSVIQAIGALIPF